MASGTALVPSSAARLEIYGRGGEASARCYQCATCSSVCELATEDHTFPRRQMLWTQWGLRDRLAGDPGIWLCHQCNDCTVRCPRDARPGDIMQVARGMAIEELAFPRFVGHLVGRARTTWVLLLGIPFLFWTLLVYLHNGLTPAAGGDWAYAEIVPHWMIYSVYFPTFFVLAGVPALVGASRAWKKWGEGRKRAGSFVTNLIAVLTEIVVHRRFGKCGVGKGRKWGHFFIFWGFILAAVTSGFLVVWLYAYDLELPLFSYRCPGAAGPTCHLPLDNWMKIMGNIGAVSLVLGGVLILINRLSPGQPAGKSMAFDNLLLAVVLLVIATGVGAEVGRLVLNPGVAMWIYIVHLSSVLCLFLSVPYSKFAHMVYRTLALVHERMVTAAKS